jgi:hypothetical protein
MIRPAYKIYEGKMAYNETKVEGVVYEATTQLRIVLMG